MILTLAIENDAVLGLEMCNLIKESVLVVWINNILTNLRLIIETEATNVISMDATSWTVEEKWKFRQLKIVFDS
jgi:hypothetical protein